eukprot:scaffold3683_cov118-Isochrysis_galbana.AAC.2
MAAAAAAAAAVAAAVQAGMPSAAPAAAPVAAPVLAPVPAKQPSQPEISPSAVPASAGTSQITSSASEVHFAVPTVPHIVKPPSPDQLESPTDLTSSEALGSGVTPAESPGSSLPPLTPGSATVGSDDKKARRQKPGGGVSRNGPAWTGESRPRPHRPHAAIMRQQQGRV